MSDSTPERTAPPPQRPRTAPGWWVLFAGGLVLAAAGAIIWLGAINAPDGDPLVENPGGLVGILFGGVVSLTAVILPRLNTIRDSTAATQHHVVNDHGDKVMRVDLDQKHEAVLVDLAQKNEAVLKAISALDGRVSGMARDQGRIDTRQNGLLDRIDYVSRRVDKALDRIDDLEDNALARPKEKDT